MIYFIADLQLIVKNIAECSIFYIRVKN